MEEIGDEGIRNPPTPRRSDSNRDAYLLPLSGRCGIRGASPADDMVVQHPQRYATTLAGLSFAAYVSMFTWKFALLILGSLAFHELGHIWAMRKCGMKT